jgi:hypothetical protein
VDILGILLEQLVLQLVQFVEIGVFVGILDDMDG